MIRFGLGLIHAKVWGSIGSTCYLRSLWPQTYQLRPQKHQVQDTFLLCICYNNVLASDNCNFHLICTWVSHICVTFAPLIDWTTSQRQLHTQIYVHANLIISKTINKNLGLVHCRKKVQIETTNTCNSNSVNLSFAQNLV